MTYWGTFKPPSPSKGVIKLYLGSTLSDAERLTKLSCSRLKETRGIDFGKTILYIKMNIRRRDLPVVVFPSKEAKEEGASMGYVDLHIHTTASDGVMTPSEVVRYAKDKGLQAVAITDHDTIEGLEEGLAEGNRIGLEVIPGIEISAEHSPGSMHLLGFFIDIAHPLLNEKLGELQRARAERNPKMLEKLNRLGIEVTYEEVLKASGGGQVGRPHFAQVLFEKGYVRSFQEAFDRFLKKGAPAYVEKFRFSAKESIHFINETKGVAVLAHPNTLNMNGYSALENLLLRLVKEGLKGIEALYPEHSTLEVAQYKTLAQRYGLLITGGTDYHGIEKDSLEIGVGRGGMKLPYSMVEDLRAAHRRSLRSNDK